MRSGRKSEGRNQKGVSCIKSMVCLGHHGFYFQRSCMAHGPGESVKHKEAEPHHKGMCKEM